MAETRKHRVEVRDELDKALYAALGQPVRPAEPGPPPNPSPDASRVEPPATDEAEPEASEQETEVERHRSATRTFVTPGSTLAGFTFGHTSPPGTG